MEISQKTQTFVAKEEKSMALRNSISREQKVSSMVDDIRRYFANQPVTKAWLFGSYSRGEETSDSDVDILITLDKTAHVGLFKLSGMYLDLQDLLNKKVDLVVDSGLMDFARESVERDKKLIYERTS